MKTNGNTDIIFSSIDCGEIYRQIFLSLYQSINTNKKISLVYTEGIAVREERIKKTRKYDDV